LAKSEIALASPPNLFFVFTK